MGLLAHGIVFKGGGLALIVGDWGQMLITQISPNDQSFFIFLSTTDIAFTKAVS
ncbi:hypothetical protein ISG33_11040 [Glaciecola sp. MH2013]|uniref:hypothetical protein n=1 Tax=Glaciecola sp. MH2013 TaxID=2785524 RepID=UPI00189E6E3F|nr:hypothetical protein [Glaciecola sp. MH2013]MBF7073935.1 hypothetical protein [Glaciecola sp. MH2013]